MTGIREGDIIEWMAVNGPVRGYVVDEDGVSYVLFGDGHSFFLKDIIRTPGLKVVGKVKVR